MKKILATLAAVLCCATMFTSCNKDNHDSEDEILNFAPLIQWGCNISDVEKHMQSKEWWANGNDKLEYWEDPYKSWHKWYFVDNADLKLTEQYLFETKDGQNLRYAISICWNKDVPAQKFKNTLIHQGFHSTGFMVEFADDIYEVLLSSDGKTEALYLNDVECYIAIYRPVEK